MGTTGDPTYDFHISLLDTLGTNYFTLPSTPRIVSGNLVARLQPGEVMRTDLRLNLDSKLKPGTYELEFGKGLFVYKGDTQTRCKESLVSNKLSLDIE